MSDFKHSTVLVTGASGNLGRQAVEALLDRGATKVIAGTRDPSRLADLAARGVGVRTMDFDDAASLATALEGVDRMLLVSTDSLGRRAEQQAAVVRAAAKAGVSHVVYTSAPAARPNPDRGVSPEHFWTEQALATSPMNWTVLRNHIYAEAVLMGAGAALASGQLFHATGNRGRAYVTRGDTARTAAGALLIAEGNAIYDVTGPTTVTQSEVATLLADITGKAVAAIDVTPELLRAGLVGAGLPAPIADLMVAFDIDAAEGQHGIVTAIVEQFSGRKPQSLADFLSANAATLRR